EVDLDNVGQIDEGLIARLPREVVQSQPVTQLLKVPAGGDHLGLRRHRLQNFDHGSRQREQFNALIGEQALRTIDEPKHSRQNLVGAHGEKAIGDHLQGGVAAVETIEAVRLAGAVEQLICVDIQFPVENCLPG